MEQETFDNQLQRTFETFKEKPRTMKEAEVLTGIDRPNICRYVAHFQKRGTIAVYQCGKCPITKHRAKFYTTDPALIPEPGQVEIFPRKNPMPD